eukprot:9358803-Pyramimonas_sp.AAC.1
MRTVDLEPSVELPTGPRNTALGVRNAGGGGGPRSTVLGRRGACGRPHWGLQWSSVWGHEALCWAWGAHAASPHLGLRWSPLRA